MSFSLYTICEQVGCSLSARGTSQTCELNSLHYSHTCIHHPSNNTFNLSLILFFTPGPPGAPGGVRVINKTDKSVTLQWSRGADNHSPISKYTIQYRNSFSKDVWKNATTCENSILVGQINTVTLMLS